MLIGALNKRKFCVQYHIKYDGFLSDLQSVA